MKLRMLILLCAVVISFCALSKPKLTPIPMMTGQANLGRGCNVAATFPASKFGGFSGDSREGTGGIGIQPLPLQWHFKFDEEGLHMNLYCRSSNEQETRLARFDPQTQHWTKDLYARFGDMTSEDRKVLDKATSVLTIKAVNASGFVTIEEDTTGDEGARRRVMDFCLYHPPDALCGRGDIGRLEDGLKGDMTRYALEIIQSIKFLPDPPLPSDN